MAATGKTPILLYGSTTTSNVPAAGNLTNSSDGCEIAINVADKNLFFKDSTNAVNTVPIRQSGASSNGWLSSTDWNTFNGKAPAVTYTINYIPYGQGTTTLNQSANLTFDGANLGIGNGNVVIGTSGKGIDFSATSGAGTSELLADYEEGTWTPTQGAGVTVVGTFSSAGTYTKVGRMVTVRGTLTGTTTVACAAGSILTEGLPFAPASISTGGAINDNLNGSSVTYVSPAGPSIYVHSAIAAAGTIALSATYFV